MNNIVEIKNLSVNFHIKNRLFKQPDLLSAVNDVNFNIKTGEAFGLVGESGCGKTTIANSLLNLIKPSSGNIYFQGKDINRLNKRELYQTRKDMQMIFQDPFSSLNPRLEVWELIGEPLLIRGEKNLDKIRKKATELLLLVGLSEKDGSRYAYNFSGGQRQRIVIARALALSPKFIVCDEPVSSLDVSVNAQIINLLKSLQIKLGLTYLFISHNLALIRHFTDNMAVMYLGSFMEYGSTEKIFSNPIHPYTKALLSAILDVYSGYREDRVILQGEVASPINPPMGCRFYSRCPLANEKCKNEKPPLVQRELDHFAACFYA